MVVFYGIRYGYIIVGLTATLVPLSIWQNTPTTRVTPYPHNKLRNLNDEKVEKRIPSIDGSLYGHPCLLWATCCTRNRHVLVRRRLDGGAYADNVYQSRVFFDSFLVHCRPANFCMRITIPKELLIKPSALTFPAVFRVKTVENAKSFIRIECNFLQKFLLPSDFQSATYSSVR